MPHQGVCDEGWLKPGLGFWVRVVKNPPNTCTYMSGLLMHASACLRAASAPRAGTLLHPLPPCCLHSTPGSPSGPSRAPSGLVVGPGCAAGGSDNGTNTAGGATSPEVCSKAGFTAVPATGLSESNHRSSCSSSLQVATMQHMTWPPAEVSTQADSQAGVDPGSGCHSCPGDDVSVLLLAGSATAGSQSSTAECGVLSSTRSGYSSLAGSTTQSHESEEAGLAGHLSPDIHPAVGAMTSVSASSGSASASHHYNHHHHHHPLPRPAPSPFASTRQRPSRISRVGRVQLRQKKGCSVNQSGRLELMPSLICSIRISCQKHDLCTWHFYMHLRPAGLLPGGSVLQ